MSKQETNRIKAEQESRIEDLPLTDEQADETKGGAGGPGTRDSHWRESLFGNELMSP